MKKILIFVDWYEPGYRAGGPIRSVKNLVDQFKGAANFFIVTRNTDYQSTEPYAGVEADTWTDVDQQLHIYYASAQGLQFSAIRKILHEKAWDVVYLNGIYSWFFSILPLWLLRSKKIRTIVAPRGMLASGALGVKSRKKQYFLYLSRISGLYQKVVFHATHAGEASEIRAHIAATANIYVLPNLAAVQAKHQWQQREKNKGNLQLVSIARISPEKNTKYLLEVLALIPAGVEITADLYGPVNDLAYWEECQSLIQTLPQHVQVNYKGSLPNELVKEILKTYHLMVLPSLGENFGHIIVESFAAATPVLISDRTPWQELERAGVGWSLPLGNKDRFAAAILEIVAMEQQAFDQLSKSTYAYGVAHVNNTATIEKYQQLFGF